MHDDQWDDEFPDDGYDYSQHFYDPNKNGVEYDFRTFFIPSEKAKRGIKDLLTSGVLERDLDYVDEEGEHFPTMISNHYHRTGSNSETAGRLGLLQ